MVRRRYFRRLNFSIRSPRRARPSPCLRRYMERFEKKHFALVGNVDDVRREMDGLVEAGNPEWFIWQGDQGYLPIAEVRKQLELFGKHIMPHYL